MKNCSRVCLTANGFWSRFWALLNWTLIISYYLNKREIKHFDRLMICMCSSDMTRYNILKEQKNRHVMPRSFEREGDPKKVSKVFEEFKRPR